MRKLFTLLLLLSSACAVWAQDAGGYSSRYTKIYREYLKDPQNVASNLEMALFYADSLNPMCNYATAMNYISAAEEHYIAIVEDRDKYKEVSRLIKKKVTINLVRQTKRNIISQARIYLDSRQSVPDATLDSYALAFKNDPTTLRLVDNKRMQARYDNAIEANTLAAYRTFLETYAATMEGEDVSRRVDKLANSIVAKAKSESQVDSLLAGYLDMEPVKNAAYRRKSAIAYSALRSNPTPGACRSFLSRYPGSDHYSDVLELMENMQQKDFSNISSPAQLADFALQNPDSPLAEKAVAELRRLITEERNMQALHIYLDEFTLDINYSDIYLEYFKWHTAEGNKSPLDLFAEQNPEFPFSAALADALTAAERFDSVDINMPFRENEFRTWASKVYHLTGKKESFVALQRTLQPLIAAKNWKKADERIDFFAICFEDYCVDEVAELRSIIDRPVNPRLSYTPIVRPSYDMIHPVMHPDGKYIYYNRVSDGILSIQMARLTPTKNSAIWKGSGNVVFTNIKNDGLHIFSLFDGGNKMLLGAEGDIMVAELGDNGWSVTEVLPSPINSEYYDYDAFMLPDGSGILFASDRPGGQNLQPSRSYFHGDTALASDIYFVPRTNAGWGEAVNLGINVNSPYMECSPMISDDLKTLYFVSDGHAGLGYADIYYTTRDHTDDWQHWNTPVNYGKEVNSGFNEISVSPSADSNAVIICSNANGRYGCYSATAFHTIDNRFSTVTVKSGDVGFTVDVADLTSQRFVVNGQPVAEGASWQSSFSTNRQYLLFSRCDGLFIPAVLFSPSNDKELSPEVYDPSALTKLSQPLALPGISFDERKSTLKTYSETEIDHLAQFLRSHSSLNIELVIHVDGSDDTFCFNLSQARGREIKRRLSDKGVDADRITVSAYGNSMTKRGEAQTSVSILFTY